jgi:hypothetical protein
MLLNDGNYKGKQVLSPASVKTMLGREWLYDDKIQQQLHLGRNPGRCYLPQCVCPLIKLNICFCEPQPKGSQGHRKAAEPGTQSVNSAAFYLFAFSERPHHIRTS